MQQKEPSTGFMLELLGLVGFLGIGHIWAGRVLRGMLLMIGYWLVFLFMDVLAVLGILAQSGAGYITRDQFSAYLLLACSYLLVPIASGAWLQRELRAAQHPPDINAPLATPQDQSTNLIVHQPFNSTKPPSQYAPAPPLPQSPLIYQPYYQSPDTLLPGFLNRATPERKPVVGLLELLFLYVGPILLVIGNELTARREYSDGTVEHLSPLWPLGVPLVFLGICSIIVFSGLAIFRKHI